RRADPDAAWNAAAGTRTTDAEVRGVRAGVSGGRGLNEHDHRGRGHRRVKDLNSRRCQLSS
ncbi:hypothetical protein, partial [Nocardioides sp.]|uniref:hypothetical protein n=1 Tax=Nocardioides sp. TaxID=35761 RepID=UPI002732B2B8